MKVNTLTLDLNEKVAIEGCAHGELDAIYDTLQYIEQTKGFKIDLLLCCGDFQAVRNEDDLQSLAVPLKYRSMNSFYKYYSGEKVAPVLTIFIGGNHEASNHLQELYYGGWVAPNIYYLGICGVVQFRGLRIAGLSGIYKAYNYYKGHFEKLPFSDNDIRSIYHVREYEVFKMLQISKPLDVFLSHDWPQGIIDFGDKQKLFRQKSFLKDEGPEFGNPASTKLMQVLQPSFWFAAHMHTKFPAVYTHTDSNKQTKFLSLSKVKGGHDFLQVLDFEDPSDEQVPQDLMYDPEWMCILLATMGLYSESADPIQMPNIENTKGTNWRYDFRATEEEVNKVIEKAGGLKGLVIPKSTFVQNVTPYNPNKSQQVVPPTNQPNPQTPIFFSFLNQFKDLVNTETTTSNNPEEIKLEQETITSVNPDEISLDDD